MISVLNAILNNNLQLGKFGKTIFCLFFVVAIFLPENLKAEPPADYYKTIEVTLYYFWSRNCPHCIEAKPFVNNLSKSYPWLTVHSYDLVHSQDNQKLYLQMAEQLQQS